MPCLNSRTRAFRPSVIPWHRQFFERFGTFGFHAFAPGDAANLQESGIDVGVKHRIVLVFDRCISGGVNLAACLLIE
jgi:hypothetical protein